MKTGLLNMLQMSIFIKDSYIVNSTTEDNYIISGDNSSLYIYNLHAYNSTNGLFSARDCPQFS